MLAGYKRNNRHNRSIRKLQRRNGESASEWKEIINRGCIEYKYRWKYPGFTPRDIRQQNYFKLQRKPNLRDWYRSRVLDPNRSIL